MRRKKMLFIVGAVLLAAVCAVLGGIKLYRVAEANRCGICLSFDDYNAENWEDYFPLFEKYGVKVTFFVTASEPTDFCYHAIEAGHDIGFHTVGHVDMSKLDEDEVYQQAIAPIETFREKGIELTSFAYPYGMYSEELNQRLLSYYKVVRGAWYYQLVGKAQMRHGFVESYPLHSINHPSDEEFRESIDAILDELSRNKGAIANIYSHAIAGGDWNVTEERLEYILKKATEMGFKFYTYRELQEN